MIYIEPGKTLYKGNLHMHTTRSDGRLTPALAIERYRSQGYDFVALTDHWAPSAGWEEGGVLVLPGVELDFDVPRQALHLVVVGADPAAFALLGRDAPQAAIDRAIAAGGRVILAHPAWSLNTSEMIRSLKGLWGAEVFNAVSGPPWNADRSDSSGILDVAAANGERLNLFASDDAHFYEGDQCRGFIRVQADAKTPAAIIRAIDEGKFYASTGAAFTCIERVGDEIRLSFEPANEVTFYSDLNWVQGRCTVRPGQTSAVYRIHASRGETFVRCRIRDSAGGQAWTNPFAV